MKILCVRPTANNVLSRITVNFIAIYNDILVQKVNPEAVHVRYIELVNSYVLSSNQIMLFGRGAGAGFPTLVAASVP